MFPAIVADDKGIKAFRSGRVSADDEFLAQVDQPAERRKRTGGVGAYDPRGARISQRAGEARRYSILRLGGLPNRPPDATPVENTFLAQCTEQNNELQRFATSSSLRNAACLICRTTA